MPHKLTDINGWSLSALRSMSLSIRSTSSSPRRGQRLRAPRRSSLAIVECLLENRWRNPRQQRKIFHSSADGARVEEQGEDVAGEWVDLCGKALLGQNSRLMQEAEEKERKTKVKIGRASCRERVFALV